ncbi:MAG: hypothetical protein J6125_00570 [Clostridia bacterium]|nr:hypothetical protein [Clostridia bacterium]
MNGEILFNALSKIDDGLIDRCLPRIRKTAETADRSPRPHPRAGLRRWYLYAVPAACLLLVAGVLWAVLFRPKTPLPPEKGGSPIVQNDPANEDPASENELPTDGPSPVDPPRIIPFHSLEEIRTFLTCAKGDPTQYENFVTESDISAIYAMIDQTTAREAAEKMETCEIPVITGSTEYQMSASFYVEYPMFDFTYRVAGIRYRFVIRYGETSGFERTDAPVSEGLELGPYAVDLYQGDECFIGRIYARETPVSIIVYTDRIVEVSFDCFDMALLSEIIDGSD